MKKNVVAEYRSNEYDVKAEELSHVLNCVVQDALVRAGTNIYSSLADICERSFRNFSDGIYDSIDANKLPLDFILPQGAKMCYRQGRKIGVVVEEPPRTRTLKCIPSMQSGEELDRATDRGENIYIPQTYSLALPYVTFIFDFQLEVSGNVVRNYNVSLHFGKKPIVSKKSKLYHTILSNVEPDSGVICMGDIKIDSPRKIEDLGIWMDKYRSVFWQAVFTHDYNESFIKIGSRSVLFSSLRRWEDWSKQKPLYALEAPYKEFCRLEQTSIFQTSTSEAIYAKQIKIAKHNLYELLCGELEGIEFEKFSPQHRLTTKAKQLLCDFLHSSTKDITNMYEEDVAEVFRQLEIKIDQIAVSLITGNSIEEVDKTKEVEDETKPDPSFVTDCSGSETSCVVNYLGSENPCGEASSSDRAERSARILSQIANEVVVAQTRKTW